MSQTTIDDLKVRTDRLRKKLASDAAKLEQDKVRALKKRIRRAQRRRRKLTATAARVAGKAAPKTE